MKLYYAPGACSMSPHIVAREAGVPVELVKVDLKSHTTADGKNFYDINPRGYVPTLQLDDGSVLREGPAIVQYLADLKPAAGIIPGAGTMERVRVQEWLTFIGTEIHKQFGAMFMPNSTDAAKATAKDNITKRLTEVNQHLGTQEYLVGNKFSVADAYLFTVTNWTNFVGMDLKELPNLGAFMGRIGARPKVQETLREEGLLKA